MKFNMSIGVSAIKYKYITDIIQHKLKINYLFKNHVTCIFKNNTITPYLF